MKKGISICSIFLAIHAIGVNNNAFRIFSLILIFLSSFHSSFAEGTKELRPTVGDFGSIQIKGNLTNDKALFAYYDGPADTRLNVHICTPGEKVYMGFRSSTDEPYSLQVRVKDPAGNIVFQPTTVPTTGPGSINSYANAVAGPNTIPGGAYNPFTFTATTVGDYYIEFEALPLVDRPMIDLFDITVVGLDGRVRTGRLWSKAWRFTTTGGNNPFNANLFIYTQDRIVTKVDMNGITPFEFVISSNNVGTANTGNPILDRRSKPNLNQTSPLYQIFLNDPDTTCFPSGDLGALDGNPTVTGCPGNFCINVKVTAPGETNILIDLNGVPNYQANTQDRALRYTLKKGSNCVPWDGKDGLGADIVDTTNLAINVSYINGLTHMPIYDVEAHGQGYIVTYVRPKTPTPKIVSLHWDDSNINNGTQSPMAGCIGSCHTWNTAVGNNNTINTWWFVAEDAAKAKFGFNRTIDANLNTPGKGKFNDTTVCANAKKINLYGLLEGEPNAKWRTINSSGKLGNDTLLFTDYTFSKADSLLSVLSLELSSVGGNCPVIRDTLTIHIEPIPTVDVTAPLSSCGATPFTASSAFQNGIGVTWSGQGGTISPNSTQTTIQYTPSSAEITAKETWLRATTRKLPSSLCPLAKDSVKILLTLPPTIQLPADTVLCQPNQTLSFPVSVKSSTADSIVWSSSNALAPSPLNGNSTTFLVNVGPSFFIYGTAFSKGCPSQKDSMEVSFGASPTVSATAQPTCLPDLRFLLTGSVTENSTKGEGSWKSTGNGTFLSHPDSLNNEYIPSTQDAANGTVTLTLGSKSTTLCSTSEKSVVVTIVPLPTANAGKDTTVCLNSKVSRTSTTQIGWTYQWRNTQSGPLLSSNTSHTYSIVQKTQIHLTVLNSRQCVARDSALIDTISPPVISLSGSPLCPGENKTLLAALKDPSIASNPLFYYIWKKGSNVQNSNTWQQLEYSSGGSYSLEVGVPGCSTLKAVVINARPKPEITIPLEYKYCSESSAGVMLSSSQATNNTWYAPEGLISTNSSVTVSPQVNTHYKLVAANASGCKDSVLVLVKRVCPPRLYVPNVITPESNDVNASLKIFGANYSNFEITIFNRWGEVVFNSKDPKLDWSGIYKSENMPIGTYPWIVTYEGDSDEYKGPYKKVGEVTIVR